MTITIADGRGALWQWDTGRRLRVGSGVEQIHYQNRALGNSVDVDVGTDGKMLSSSGVISDNPSFVTTGFIPFDGGASHTYRIGGEGIKWDEYGARLAWYKTDFTLKGSVLSYNQLGKSIYFPTKIDDPNAAVAFTTDINVAPPQGAAYFRVSAKGRGANLIVTLDEPIE